MKQSLGIKQARSALSSIAFIILFAVIAVGAVGSTVYVLSANTGQRSTETVSYVGYAPFYGSLLPFMANATYIGPINPSRSIVIGFMPRNNASGSWLTDLVSWEETVGLNPGMNDCTSAEGVTNVNGTYSYWTSTLSCSINYEQTNTTFGRVEVAMNVTINLYKYQGETFFANPTNPYLPQDLVGSIVFIGDLNNFSTIAIF